MRNALLSAQKVSAQTEVEAKARAEAILAKARAEAEKAVAGISALTAAEQDKLAEAQRRSNRFLADMRTLCQKQLEFLNSVSAVMPKPTAEPAADDAEETISSIENSVNRAVGEPAPRLNIPAGAPAADEADEDGTRVFNFGA